MKKARISELKDRLSHYLRFVREGHSVLIYDRDRPIARLEPVGDARSLVRRSTHHGRPGDLGVNDRLQDPLSNVVL